MRYLLSRTGLLEGKQPLDRETEAYTGENLLRRNKRPLAEDWRK